MKDRQQVEGSKPRRRKTTRAKARPHGASFIGTRPLKLQMILRGQAVVVKVLPAIGTTTHVNYEITISRGSKVLDWVPTRAELERIGRELAMRTERETSH